MFDRRVEFLVENFGLTEDSKVLVVGCAFGFLNEKLLNHGIEEVYGIDPGSWIWEQMEEEQPNPRIREQIVEDWVGSASVADSLRRIGAPLSFDLIVDEDAAPAHDSLELPRFFGGLDRLDGRVVHFVTPIGPSGPGDSSQLWLTLDEWRSQDTAALQFWVDAGAV
jgi:hypothetical protein